MRRCNLFPILGLAVLLAAPLPVAARDMTAAGHGFSPSVAPQQHRSSVASPFLRHRLAHRHHRAAFGGIWPWWPGDYGFPDDYAVADAAPAQLAVPVPSRGPLPAVPSRPTVETTPEGVTIIRGTGSHSPR